MSEEYSVPIHQQKTTGIRSAIEQSYLMTLDSVTDLQNLMLHGRGSVMDSFYEFHRWFSKLYMLTHLERVVAERENGKGDKLVDVVKSWLKQQEHSEEDIQRGMNLFESYQETIVKKAELLGD